MTADERTELARRYFDAVHRDPAETVQLYTPGAVLHYSGGHRLSGDHHGPAAVQTLFQKSREAFAGSQRLEVHDVLGSEHHAIALLAASAERGGITVRWNRVVVFHMADGRISEQWIVDGDQRLVDELIGS
ncbi:MAG: nuclear transport factor 2 family protein [Candidatus Dormibacteraeota bacterium]|nr:nuclear transport factor 2 family protein [Candidatus Dormibacteraeota bacterium]